MEETTFAMLKPDCVQRGIIGEVLSRLEKKGLRISAMKLIDVSEDIAAVHYKEHKGKDFYGSLLSYISSGPVIILALTGDSAIKVVRKVVGKTDPKEADPGTVRGDFAMDVSRNIVHASDSLESADRELGLFFDEKDYVDYRRIEEEWIYP
ncbi:MAG: nucleoside-diphosphate kinase [Thermoplasmata archaeon]